MSAEVGVVARRIALQPLAIDSGTHAGLALQRFLKGHKPKDRDNKQTMPEEELLDSVAQLGASEVYKFAFCRWQQFALSQPADRARRSFSLTAAAPIAIGLGNASPLEVGITLHHTYGMPIIPGSALKGLCRRGALQLLSEGKMQQCELNYLFGTGGDRDAAAGAIVFYDAWYDPCSVKGKPFHRDVITVHHPQYYQSRGSTPPTDFDDPNPVPFLVIKPDAKFLFALDAVSPEWAQFTENLLRWCLIHLGVGAKTNAGYGYFRQSDDQSTPSSSKGSPHTAEVLEWKGASVRYDRGKRTLSASYEGKTAIADEQTSQKLMEELPSELREQLQAKSVPLNIRIKQVGNQRTITDIIL